MRFAGTRTFRAAPEEIWAYLMTPERLRRCLPGCERFEPTGPDVFGATLRLGVAFLKGTYHGSIRVTEQDHPARLGLAVEGSGALGSLHAQGVLTFAPRAPAGGGGAAGRITDVHYEGESHVGGPIAALGEHVVEATSQRLIDRFFSCLANQIERSPER